MDDSNSNPKEFDKFAANYQEILRESVSTLGYKYDSYFDEYKILEIRDFLKSICFDKEELSFLNFGCGIGKSEPFIRKHFQKANIFSIDVSAESVSCAIENNNGLSDVAFKVFDGVKIPFETDFDIILVANVMHHVPFDKHKKIIGSIFESLNENGYLFVFEHNPYNPVTRRVVGSCVFDKNARLLDPGYCRQLLNQFQFTWKATRYTLFFPKLFRFFRSFEKVLRRLPVGAQYYCVCKK